ncbi:alpha/beta fold hydrolase [Nakamurella antarctica]|nr:alpha/beta fold hydrolase [Nakamurella antarctica]
MATFNAVHEIFIDELSVRVYSNGTGPSVLMLHDLGSSVGWFAELSSPLVSAGHEFVAIDLPGCGHSDAVRDQGLASCVDHVAAAMCKLFDGPVDIVGRGFGGYLALSVAARYPELVSRLVLDSPTLPPASGPHEKLKMAPGMAISGAGATLRRGRIRHNISGLSRARSFLAELCQTDKRWWAAVSAITAPTLIVDDGDQAGSSKIEALVAAIPGVVRGRSLPAQRKFVPASALSAQTLLDFLKVS